MRFFQKIIPLLVCLAVLPHAARALASTIVNEDEARYEYKLYWDDLEPVQNGTIGPGESVAIRDSRGIVELVGQYDNIYVKPGETLHIRSGILLKD